MPKALIMSSCAPSAASKAIATACGVSSDACAGAGNVSVSAPRSARLCARYFISSTNSQNLLWLRNERRRVVFRIHRSLAAFRRIPLAEVLAGPRARGLANRPNRIGSFRRARAAGKDSSVVFLAHRPFGRLEADLRMLAVAERLGGRGAAAAQEHAFLPGEGPGVAAGVVQLDLGEIAAQLVGAVLRHGDLYRHRILLGSRDPSRSRPAKERASGEFGQRDDHRHPAA